MLTQEQKEQLLSEILPAPSQRDVQHFIHNEAADCNGQCRAGECMTVTHD